MITPKQRKYLKGLAQELSPIVMIGKDGPRVAVRRETREDITSLDV